MKKFLGKKTNQSQAMNGSSFSHTSLKYLVLVMASITAVPVSQADTGAKQIGDLEIYKAAEGGKITVMMMLDTSGSMSEPYMKKGFSDGDSACDIDGQSYTSMPGTDTMPNDTTNPLNYKKYGCMTGTATQVKKYFGKEVKTTITTTTVKNYSGLATRSPKYTSNPQSRDTPFTLTSTDGPNATSTWTDCGMDGSKDVNACTNTVSGLNTSGLTKETGTTQNPPNQVTGPSNSTETNVTVTEKSTGNKFTYASAGVVTKVTTTTKIETIYYYKMVDEVDPKDMHLDRLTRLKDAIFNLLDKGGLDASKVAIGVGQFSSQSDSSNTYDAADGKSGKILVPAALLTADQITKIKTAVAALQGGGGTPSADAYAEAGAYMLGTTTIGSVTTTKEKYVKYSASIASPCTAFSGDNCTTYSNNNRNQVYISDLTNAGYTAAPCKDSANAGKTCYSTTTTTSTATSGDSGFNKSITTSKDAENSDIYNSPVTKDSQCDGNGIYFLTDGVPNGSRTPDVLMKVALDTKGSGFSVPSTGTLEEGSDTNNGIKAIGEFSKWLRDAGNNPKNTSIRTAVVGFGSVFNLSNYDGIEVELKKPILVKSTSLPSYTGTGATKTYLYDKDGKKDTYIDCTKIPVDLDKNNNDKNVDARNACQWGAKSHPELPGVGGYGEGGFTSADRPEDITKSIIKFVADLDTTLPSTSSGTIVVPDDPYRVDSQMAVAFYPTLQPDIVSTSATWAGNMKKFKLDEGTLYGNSNTKLFKDSSGALNPEAEDLWSSKAESGKNNAVTAGGLYSNLVTPKAATNIVRKVYIEDMDTTDNTKPKLRQLGVNASGKITLSTDTKADEPLSASNTFVDTGTYTKERVQALLQFMGFELSPEQKVAELIDLVLTPPTTEVKVLGATVHSTPSAISYYAALDSDGKVTDTRDDYMLFGSSDGALHLVGADNYGTGDGGKEKFAFIPKAMLTNQLPALNGGAGKATGVPYFGVDAPWLVSATYNYDTDNSKVTVTPCTHDASKGDRECENAGVYAYGGLRMGGEALYGMNLTDKDKPSLMFSITPTGSFSRMGQIWSKPTKAKIRTSATDTKGTDVIVFGGGYDTCYENPYFQIGVAATADNKIDATCAAKTETKGNAVYIVNAKTGALIWSASASGSPTTTVTDMKNSVVGGITVLDRNNDGFLDHLYYADLGGQIFRADFSNASAATASSSFTNTRVVTILKNKYSGATDAKEFAFRFYERPVISFYRDNNNKLFALVNIISGDRSSPLSTTRTDNVNADRLYGIMDKDVTQADSILYKSDFTKTIENLTDNELVELGSSNMSSAEKTALITPLKSGTKKGWYYRLTRFDGFGKVKYNKGIGKSEVINSFLFTTVYNPDISYTTTDSCAAKIKGGSERELYCLPYGVCTDDASKNGTGGFIPAGQGIQELTLGPRSSTSRNQRLLIGTMTLTERSSDNTTLGNKRVDFGTDGKEDRIKQTGIDQSIGDGSAPEYIFNERYTMTPTTWYEANR